MITKIHSSYMARFLLIPILIMGLLGIHPPQPVLASATLKVLNTTDSGPGSLRQAIASAAAGDTIVFDASLSAKTIVLASTLVINKSVTIDGSSLASKITISGNKKVRVFDIAKPEIKVTLNSLQIVNGFISSSEGGGLGNRGTLTIKNCVFSANTANHGGAIINGGTLSILDTAFTGNVAMGPSPNSISLGGAIWSIGTLMIKNSTFTNNVASSSGMGGAISNNGPLRISNSTFSGNQAENGGMGGALDNNSGGIADIENSIFIDNSAQDGGGISNYETLSITTSTFISNTSTGNGGGIWNRASLILFDSTFFNNTAGEVYMSGSGGGIDNEGTGTITGSTFSKNTAAHGAAINNSSTLTVLNSTFSENIHTGILNSGTLDIKNSTISGGGAGVFPSTLGIYNEYGTLNLSNTILANSYSEDCFNQYGTGIVGTNVNNLIQSNAAAPNDCGTPALTADPMLAPLGNNGGLTQTMALQPGSPAIDAGDAASCPATDQRGIIRPQGSQCDIGAYELRGGGALPATPSFADVPVTHPYWEDIEILYANGLTGGCATGPIKFCPDQIMNRGAAAVFILRANFGSSYEPPVPTHIFQDDWTKGPWAEAWAEGMKKEGLSAGCVANPLKYCPWDQIPREQAVIFALRMKYGTLYTPPPATGTLFADMTNPGYYATSWAEQAYKEGIIPYCGMSAGKPKICPKDLVSRGLAAYMIVRAKNLTMP